MSTPTIRNVVLVHGGFVDGSGWQAVYDCDRRHVQPPAGNAAMTLQRAVIRPKRGQPTRHEDQEITHSQSPCEVRGSTNQQKEGTIMALSDQLSRLSARVKELEDRAAAAQQKARTDLEQDVERAKEASKANAAALRMPDPRGDVKCGASRKASPSLAVLSQDR